VKNAVISWSVTGYGQLDHATSITDASGNTTVNITNTTAEHLTVTASTGSLVRSLPSIFTGAVADLDFILTKNNSHADGVDQDRAVVTVKDPAGNPMPGVAIDWQVNNGATIISAGKTTDGKGQAIISVVNHKAGPVRLTASAGGKSVQLTATFIQAPISNIAVTMSTDNALADGTSANVAHARVTDTTGQPAAGVSLTWSLAGSAVAATPLTVTTDASGDATLRLTDAVAETVSVSASAGGQQGQTSATFTALKAVSISFRQSGKGNSADPGIVTATIKDKTGHGISGAHVAWTPIQNNRLHCSTPDTITNGAGEVSLVCYTSGANVVSQPITTTVLPEDSQDPGQPVTGTYNRDYNL
jgi:adhesin/invasin